MAIRGFGALWRGLEFSVVCRNRTWEGVPEILDEKPKLNPSYLGSSSHGCFPQGPIAPNPKPQKPESIL